MNKRIKSIERESGLEIYGLGLDRAKWEAAMTKFAELIVQECVAQIRPMWNQVKEVGVPPGYDYDTFDLAYNDCMNAIKQHFGVE
jgi:hypothetical protein